VISRPLTPFTILLHFQLSLDVSSVFGGGVIPPLTGCTLQSNQFNRPFFAFGHNCYLPPEQ
jgi:hypothetical protein